MPKCWIWAKVRKSVEVVDLEACESVDVVVLDGQRTTDPFINRSFSKRNFIVDDDPLLSDSAQPTIGRLEKSNVDADTIFLL